MCGREPTGLQHTCRLPLAANIELHTGCTEVAEREGEGALLAAEIAYRTHCHSSQQDPVISREVVRRNLPVRGRLIATKL